MTFLLRIYIAAFVLFVAPMSAFAHGTEATVSLNDTLAGTSLRIVLWAVVLFAVILLITVLVRRKTQRVKRLLFGSLLAVILVGTFSIVGTTVAVNMMSWSKGPVHWHADFQVWACGQKLNLVDPVGFSNRVGSPLFHEHNDERMHVEGVIGQPDEVTLARFFRNIGGDLHVTSLATGDVETELTIPTNDRVATYKDGDLCPDGRTGEWQAFLYTVDKETSTFSQRLLPSFNDYMMSHESQVPPGDCIILEFGTPKDKTYNLCQSYEVNVRTGKVRPQQ